MEVINVNCLVYSTQTVGSLTLFAKYTSVCTSPLWCCIAVFVMYPICLIRLLGQKSPSVMEHTVLWQRACFLMQK